MAEIETALPPTEQTPVVDHREKAAIHNSINEMTFPSHGRRPQHRDNRSALETEEFSELYDPTVYGGAIRPDLNPQ